MTKAKLQKVCVVVPTYNEADNVQDIVRQLLAVFDPESGYQVSVLVVDDNSPDGTGQLVEQLRLRDDRVHLLAGAKRGLGSAYSRGFEHALQVLDVDVVVQMDADFSHAPADVPRLVTALADADVVIGSRYVQGGSIDAVWGRRRRLLSRLGNLFARYVAGLYRIRDCTAGFKAIRTSALRQAFPLRLSVQGYVFQVASLHALWLSDSRILEIPIHFAERKAGVTKLGLRDIGEFFVHVWWLRLLSRKTFIKFAITGATGVLVNLGCFQLLRESGLNPYVASPIAIEISIIWNFFLNNFWTFRDRTISTRRRVRGVKFNAVSLLTLALSFATFVTLRQVWPAQPELLSQALSIVPAAMANYFANSYWTFRADKV